jgi:hypothetical protein
MTHLALIKARAEFLRRADWTKAAADYVKVNGINLEALNAYAGVLSIMSCRFLGNGYFDFGNTDAKAAVVIEIYAEDDESTIDLCAWQIEQPDIFATMFGADALGLARVVNPATWAFGGVLNIYRTPLRWLQAGCQGCVVLDHRNVPIWLRCALGAVHAEDIDHARQLDAWLNPPRFDRRRILVPCAPERMAA